MSYKVIKAFSDLDDRSDLFPNGHFYSVGDTYPRKGLKATEDRLAELSTTDNQSGSILIQKQTTSRKVVKTSKEVEG